MRTIGGNNSSEVVVVAVEPHSSCGRVACSSVGGSASGVRVALRSVQCVGTPDTIFSARFISFVKSPHRTPRVRLFGMWV